MGNLSKIADQMEDQVWEALLELAEDARSFSRDQIEAFDLFGASNALSDSHYVADDRATFRTQFGYTAKHAPYVNWGTPGPRRWPPKDPIEEWVRIKFGITDERELKEITFLVRRKIGIHGTEAVPYFSNTVEWAKRQLPLRLNQFIQEGQYLEVEEVKPQ